MVRQLLTALTVIVGFAGGHASLAAERIALTLAHRTEQLDIPASAIRRIKAKPTIVVTLPETRRRVVHKAPHVEACFTKEIRKRICELTKRVVNEPLVILVGCEPVAEPVVREPFCTQSCLRISVFDMEMAEDLAHALREGSTFPCVGPYRDAGGDRSTALALHEGFP